LHDNLLLYEFKPNRKNIDFGAGTIPARRHGGATGMAADGFDVQ